MLYSIIVPAAREGLGLYDRVRELDSALKSIYLEYEPLSSYNHEIIVVTDVADKYTLKSMIRLARERIARSLFLTKSIGKGGSIKNTIPYAKGEYIVLLDADMPVDPLFIAYSVHYSARNNIDMLIANRVYRSHGTVRHLLSTAYNAFVNMLFNTKIWDHQAGFKVMKKSIAETILVGLSRIDGFTYDTEITVLAKRLGLKYEVLDVVWIEKRDNSTIPKIRAVLTMFIDLLALRVLTLPGIDLRLKKTTVGDVMDLNTGAIIDREFMNIIDAHGIKKILLNIVRKLYVAVS